MSETLFDHNGIEAHQYAGPELPGGDRRRIQLFNHDTGALITFSMGQWRTLGEFFGADCSMECEGPRLTRPIPDTWDWPDEK